MNLEREFVRCGRAGALLSSRGGPDVKGALLGKATRYAPDRVFETLHVYLELDVDFARQALSGLCRTTVRAFKAGARELSFDAVDLKVSSVTVDGKAARFKLGDGKLKITAASPLEAGRETEVSVRYRVERPKTGLHFVHPGPHNPRNPVQVWSQSQPEDARYWYPCHDNPHEKCTSEVRATVPAGFRLISNGSLLETTTVGGKTTWHWRLDRPHSIYLISIAAGKFSEIAERWQDVPVTFYCEKGREKDARRGFAKTVKAMEFFSKITGVAYPYDKYAQVAVAEYPGGMEHTTCTTQTDACLIDERAGLDVDLDLLVAHELAHQWFGDLVTCRDWSHAWLNEGFATYFEILFQEHDKGADEAAYELYLNAQAYFDEDARRYRRPIVCGTYKNPWTLFDRHTYEKGSWVVHMLRRRLGDEAFWRSIKHYLEKHRDASVETTDLIEAIGESTGLNLRPFFDQWVYRGGYPDLTARYDWDPKSKKAQLWIVQTQEVGEQSPAFKVRLPVRFTGRGWTRDVVAELSEKEHHLSWTLPGEPLGCEVDPDSDVLKKLTLRKPHALWLHQLRYARRAQGRQLAAAAVASWGDGRAVAALEQALLREPFWGCAVEIARALGTIKSEDSFQALKRLLRVKHPKVRRAVIESLAHDRRAETAALLAPFAKRDASILVESEALRGLGALRAPTAVPLILAALSKDSYRDLVGSSAVAALAATRDPKHFATFLRLSKAPNSFMRRAQAIRALADYSPVSDRGLEAIAAAVEDQDERVSLVAVATLGQMDDERALPALEKARNHPNARLRSYAEESIARVRAGLGPKPKSATSRSR